MGILYAIPWSTRSCTDATGFLLALVLADAGSDYLSHLSSSYLGHAEVAVRVFAAPDAVTFRF